MKRKQLYNLFPVVLQQNCKKIQLNKNEMNILEINHGDFLKFSIFIKQKNVKKTNKNFKENTFELCFWYKIN